MASFSRHEMRRSLKSLRWPVRLTQTGMVAERALRSFWPFLSLCLAVIGLLMLGVQDMLALEVLWGGVVISALGALVFLVLGIRSFAWPTRAEAVAKLDATLPGRPIQALMDDAAIGADDASAMAVWRAHQSRMISKPYSPTPEVWDSIQSKENPSSVMSQPQLIRNNALPE